MKKYNNSIEILPRHYDALRHGNMDVELLKHDCLILIDNLYGFSPSYTNEIFSHLKKINYDGKILTEYIIDDEMREALKPLDVSFSATLKNNYDFIHYHDYKSSSEIEFKNFLISFNNTPTVGRYILTNILEKFGLFNRDMSSKYFKCKSGDVESHLIQVGISDDEYRFYNKFFTYDEMFLDNAFFKDERPYSLDAGGEVKIHHIVIRQMEDRLSKSFVHLASETASHTYYPFVTEKAFHSIVSRGLYITYGQPGWHSHVEEFIGFKKYDKIFDYSFDEITNPIERMLMLISMLYKFSFLSEHDWHDLYLMEQDTIDYNYEHYFSNDYLRVMHGVE